MDIVAVRDTFVAPAAGDITDSAGLVVLFLFPDGLLLSLQPAAESATTHANRIVATLTELVVFIK